MLRGSFQSAGKKSGVIWCLGGAIINKIAFLLISSLYKNHRSRTHQTVAQSVQTCPGNRRVDGSSPAIGGGDFTDSGQSHKPAQPKVGHAFMLITFDPFIRC